MSELIVVIGGGPGGIEAAQTAARAGRDVVLISDGPVGGRAGWHSLLPSKAWLAAATEVRAAGGRPDIAALLEHLEQVQREWNGAAEVALEKLGVQVLQGEAAFTAPDLLIVRNANYDVLATYNGEKVIVASGSVPTFPPELKPDGRQVLAPRFLRHLAELPQSILVVGAGATGCEAAYLFNALGVEVTWIVDSYGVLPQFHPEAGAFLVHALARQGVHLVEGQAVQRLERTETQVTAVLDDHARYPAEKAFVAIGRKPDWERLNLEAAGLVKEADSRYALDRYGRSVNNAVYLIGDADGGWMTANKALSQARSAAMHAAGVLAVPYDGKLIVRPVFTEPEVAQIGEVLPAVDLATVTVPSSCSLKSHLLAEGAGFFLLAYDVADGRVRGAVAAGPEAANNLAPIALALKMGAHVSELADLYGPYPTMSELPFCAARNVG